MDQPIVKWSQDTLIKWVNTLSSLKAGQKAEIIKGIKEFGAAGKDVFDADKDELVEAFEIGGMLAGKLFNAIGEKKNESFQSNNPTDPNNGSEEKGDDDGYFSLNLQGQKGSYCRIDKFKKTYTVKYLKKQYLDYYGHDLQNEAKRKGLSIYRMGTKLAVEDSTLESYNIVDETIELTVIFRVDGGANADKYRIRKLRHKKYKQIILSNEPDCIMGYTNKDGIKRAKMPCGCSFASDTMYRYMAAAFDQDNNFRAVTMKCPMTGRGCKGTSKQREWDWALVFIVADLTQQEKRRYAQIIQARIAGTRQCPHCEANCERDKSLKIFRVRCNSCKGSDWCWECAKPWKGGGLTVCGNSKCTADRLNTILSSCDMINPNWSPNDKVPQIRHCPECLTILEYIDLCCHMTCVGCGYEFCFKCLEKWKGNYSCTSVAAKQIIK